MLGIKFLGETPGDTLFTANIECEDLDREVRNQLKSQCAPITLFNDLDVTALAYVG